MVNQKVKWTAEEEAALRAGVAKHGPGKWKDILADPEFALKLANRSNVSLKDKWRNISTNIGHGCGDGSSTPKAEATTSTAVVPETGNSLSVSRSKEKANDSPRCPQDDKNTPKYNTMILEALSPSNDPFGSDLGAIAAFIEQKYKVPQNFRRSLSSNLSRLVSQGKLEKVLKLYKIKDSGSSTEPLTPQQSNVGQGPYQQPSVIFSYETIESAAEAAAQLVAEAENKALVAAEACRENDRVSQLADDANVVQTIIEEFFNHVLKTNI